MFCSIATVPRNMVEGYGLFDAKSTRLHVLWLLMILIFFCRQRLIQEEKARVERKKIAAEEKAKQDVAEQAVRVVQLQETVTLLKHSFEQMYKMKLEKHADKEVCMTLLEFIHLWTLYFVGVLPKKTHTHTHTHTHTLTLVSSWPYCFFCEKECRPKILWEIYDIIVLYLSACFIQVGAVHEMWWLACCSICKWDEHIYLLMESCWRERCAGGCCEENSWSSWGKFRVFRVILHRMITLIKVIWSFRIETNVPIDTASHPRRLEFLSTPL